jgi:Ser/Thr protein kinase RdoA (MazF antagonist)
MERLKNITNQFDFVGTPIDIKPLGNGLINDTYIVKTVEDEAPDYVLQRINHNIFTNPDLLQHNIEVVTAHIRGKLETEGVDDIDRKVLQFIPTPSGKTYAKVGDEYWRMMVFIPRAVTYEAVTPELSYDAGRAFGHFQAMLADVPETLEETIPNFHNMEFRLQQLHDAVAADAVGRVKDVATLLEAIEQRADEMCLAERLHREGALPKRVCHCDTKVNNMMFDESGRVLCIIDLDTVMSSYIFSDYGDFLRTAASTAPEDEPDTDKIHFNKAIFEAFTRGYIEGAGVFLLPVEINNLPYAVKLFPYMQCVRFLTDYINGDTYYRIAYPEHNLVRTRAQWKLFNEVDANESYMHQFIATLVSGQQ